MTAKDPWKHQSFRPSKIELAVMDFYKTSYYDDIRLLATKWYKI
jgi:hypothetical protein